jgi:hypothetical protein
MVAFILNLGLPRRQNGSGLRDDLDCLDDFDDSNG